MTAAIYARKSTDQSNVADDQKSVARQIERCRAYAAAKGWTVDESCIFSDDGISGAEFANRPGFLRLMNALKPKPRFQVLVMSEESRLGREAIETAYAVKQLVQAGVRVFFYLEDRERTLDSPTEKFMMSLTAFTDELEREKARQRTYDAMQRKAQSQHVTGGRVFGYDNVDVLGRDGQRSHVERRIHEGQAAIVRQIFELCALGLGKVAIAKRLNAEGAATPRAQQGRPQAWAPSSVRAVLFRETYRGEIVWNKTRKRDRWGQTNQTARPETEWMRIDAPDLRIVSDKLWAAAHARLEATRRTYLRTTEGKLWGRPASGLASKYLLTGIARCGVCGSGLEVRSGTSGKKRAFFYSCSSYYRRGRTVCPNRYEIPMAVADSTVLDALLHDLLTPDRLVALAEKLVARAKAAQDTPAVDLASLQQQIDDAHGALARLTAAVVAGGDVPSLVDAIKVQEARRVALEARIAVLTKPAVTFDAQLERRLRASVEEWRDVLGRQVAQARQVVVKLVEGRVTFAPESRDGCQGFRFTATGTVEKLIEGLVPSGQSVLQGVASPPGFEPGSWP